MPILLEGCYFTWLCSNGNKSAKVLLYDGEKKGTVFNADAQQVRAAGHGTGKSLEPQFAIATVRSGSICLQKSVREAGTLVQAHRNVPR
jgi:hypothetical protein